MDPNAADTYRNRAFARRKNGDSDGALADYTAAIRLNPTAAAAYYNRAIIRRENGDLEGAWADFKECVALGGGTRYGIQEEIEAVISELKGEIKAKTSSRHTG